MAFFSFCKSILAVYLLMINFGRVNVLAFQTLLLSVVISILLPLTAIAADDVEPAQNDTTPSDVQLVKPQDQNIMLRQVQPVMGYEPLTVAGQKIEATFLEETWGEPHGAIIFFQDKGEDLESLGVVTPLRHELLKYGWSTLTLMLDYPFKPNILIAVSPKTDESTAEISVPADPKDETSAAETTPSLDTDLAKVDEVNKDELVALPAISNEQRIEAAVASLVAKGIKRIVFLGHGAGGMVAVKVLSTITTPISALILVGTPALENNDELVIFERPILDIYGVEDLQGVPAAVNDRKVDMKRAGNVLYTSREIFGANHVYYGLEPSLVTTVRGWLYTTFVKQENSE